MLIVIVMLCAILMFTAQYLTIVSDVSAVDQGKRRVSTHTHTHAHTHSQGKNFGIDKHIYNPNEITSNG